MESVATLDHTVNPMPKMCKSNPEVECLITDKDKEQAVLTQRKINFEQEIRLIVNQSPKHSAQQLLGTPRGPETSRKRKIFELLVGLVFHNHVFFL